MECSSPPGGLPHRANTVESTDEKYNSYGKYRCCFLHWRLYCTEFYCNSEYIFESYFWRFFIYGRLLGESLAVDELWLVVVLVMPVAHGIVPSTAGQDLTLLVPPSSAMMIVTHFVCLMLKLSTVLKIATK